MCDWSDRSSVRRSERATHATDGDRDGIRREVTVMAQLAKIRATANGGVVVI
jgi:hypothetical protein